MARTRRVKSTIRNTVHGKLPTPEFHEAIRQAQEENAKMLLQRVKARFASRHKGTSRKPAGYTVQGFQSNVRQDLNLSVYNRRPNAARVEYGVEPHTISGNLNFWWDRRGRMFRTRRGRVSTVHHPGQKADPIMANTLADSHEEIIRNIQSGVSREIARS